MKKTGFKIEQESGVIIFTNYTDFVLEVSKVPIKPKRTYKLIHVVPSKSFKMFDVIDTWNMDLNSLCFRLVSKNEVKL